MRAGLVLVLGMGSLALLAQTPPRDVGSVTVPTGTASLAGIVRDDHDQPLRRAVVSIAGDMRVNLSTVTDDSGQFSFMNLPSGRFTIKAEKPGYPNASFGAKRPNRAGSGVLLMDGQHATGVVMTLARGGVLAGAVYDERGAPMAGIPIMAWEVRTSLSGDRTLDFPITGGESVSSDDRGRYRVYGLPPGDYTIGTAWFFGGGRADVRVPTDDEIRTAFEALAQPGGARGRRVPTPPAPTPRMFSYAPVFYPSSLDPMTAATIALGPGDERTDIDLRMQFIQMSRIEGTVVGPDGPVANARLELQRRSQVQALNVTSVWSPGPDGKFVSSSLAPGDYRLRALTQKTADKPAMFAVADLSIVSATPQDVTLRLEPAMTITGRCVFEGAIPPPPDLERITVTLFPTAQNQGFATNERTVVEASGTFSIPGVTPSAVRVIAGVPNPAGPTAPHWTLKSAVYGTRDVTDLTLEVSPTGLDPLTLTFTDRTQELSGAVRDAAGKPATDFFIVVIPADQKYWLLQSRRIASTRPDVQGRYIFRNLPPGSYRIAATTDLVPRDLQEMGTLAALAAQSTPVVLEDGQPKVFDLTVGR